MALIRESPGCDCQELFSWVLSVSRCVVNFYGLAS